MTKIAHTLFIASLLGTTLGQLGTKAVVFPDGLSAAFSLDQFIPNPVAYTLTQSLDITNCDLSICEGESATVYQANYQDGTINTLCVCNVSPIMTTEETAQRFGRVAYKVRRDVTGITIASTSLATGGAYSSGDVIRMLQFANTEVFTHEAAHSFDGRNGYSGSDAFNAALAADTCVPDDYARSSNAEDFAQLTVTWTYMVLSRTTQDPRFNCMSNQINFLKQLLTEADILALIGSTPSTSSTSGASCSQDYECGSYGQNYGYSQCTSSGECQCGPNFSGSSTASDLCRCDGIVSYATGRAVCLTQGTCQESWQCYEGSENSQFVSCNAGSCTCRSGFQGSGVSTDKCRCQESLTWLNGTPYCSI